MNCVILARGGSKGVPNKNIRLLSGIPLLAYPIMEAKKISDIGEIYVSTDSPRISEVALHYGAKVIERPAHLATDTSLDIDALRHAMNFLPDNEPIVQLRATTPLVNHEVLSEAIKTFESERDNCTSLRSAHRFEESVYKFFKLEGKYWSGFFPHMQGDYYNFPRQSFPANYLPNGYIDILKPDVFMNVDTLHGDRILSFITPKAIEIDCEDDLKTLENYVYNRT